MYTFEVDGVRIEAPIADRVNEALLHTALGTAAAISFQRSRPVMIKLQGKPYRVVHVTFAEEPTKRVLAP